MKPENLLVTPAVRILVDRADSHRPGHRRMVVEVRGMLCGL
jgi:hypothetical protein